VVVQADEPTATVSEPIVLTPNSETTNAAQAVTVPLVLNMTHSEEEAVTAADAQPIVMAASPSEERHPEAGILRTWWQTGTAMLLVCVGVLAPFSWRRHENCDETETKVVRMKK
jgi:hypothetical protein